MGPGATEAEAVLRGDVQLNRMKNQGTKGQVCLPARIGYSATPAGKGPGGWLRASVW